MQLEEDEVWRVNRVRIAKYYGITPAQVDAMPYGDLLDTMQVMWAEEQEAAERREKRS